MDFSRSKVLLKKINALHESAEAFENEMSQMERDLLMHYLRELYEIILHSKDSKKVLVTEQENREISPKESQQVSENLHVEPTEPEKTILPEKKEESHTPMSKPATVTATMVNNNGQLLNVTEDYDDSQEADKSEDKTDPALLSLFEDSKERNLSSRFSRLPIADVAKSMGINDRILTINELFDGDQASFNDCTRRLNAMGSFEEATMFLINGIARNNDWSSPVKKGKALAFIQLVRRRYL